LISKQLKTKTMKTIRNHNKLATAAAGLLVGMSSMGVASAASLGEYFNFTQYGAVSGGSTINGQYAGTAATVKSTGTTLDGTGLNIALGNAAANTGVGLAGSAISSYTGDFSLQIWYTQNSTANADIRDHALFGGTSSATIDNDLRGGNQALWAGYNNVSGTPQYLRPIIGDGSQWGSVPGSTTMGTGIASATLFDYVLTYSSSTHTTTAYMNGVQVSTQTTPYFTGLASLTYGIAIGGVEHPAFNDQAAAVTISSFLMYNGALSPTEIATINGLGATPTIGDLGGAGVSVVPEPSAMALSGLGGLAALLMRQRSRR
jgi:hypothetical protein